jgi:hypothetical protein
MKRFFPFCLLLAAVVELVAAATPVKSVARFEAPETLPAPGAIAALEVVPASVKLEGAYHSVQLLVMARLASGERIDVTRMGTYALAAKIGAVSATGQVSPLARGRTTLTVSAGGATTAVPVEVTAYDPDQKVDFLQDVNPVISKLGCNSGACHGAKEGKSGFKLSLRGYDPVFDVRSLIDDHAGRRVNFASPDDSLMLLKSTAAVPHEGGQRTEFGDKYYRILRAWVADGAKVRYDAPRVSRIELFPQDPVVQTVGARQQMRIVATYADGAQRDVTAEAFIESGNVDVVTTDGGGLVRTLRRGEAPVLARYEGNYAATTVTVMGDRSGFEWREPEQWNQIDALVAAKWQRMKILPSGLCTDEDFLRRVQLDLTGLPPTADEVRAFMSDPRPTRVKRDAVIERLVGAPDYVDHWTNKWADLLQVNRKFLGEEGAKLFREWIRTEVAANTPYDQLANKILTASGSNRENPAASYYKVLRTPAETMENTTHLFLATRFNCNKCHDHPFERWTQDQYYQMAAFFAQVDLKKDPASGNKTIAGSAVEGAKPLYEIAYDKTEGEVKHDRTGAVTAPDFPYAVQSGAPADQATRRERLAAWITSPDNRYFALSYVNRMWGYLTGVGLIDPLDDIRAGNPPSNPELLQWLTREFIAHRFDVRWLQKAICQSRTYQLSVATHRWNADDKTNYSHALARRLPAEVLFDAVLKVTGSTPNFPGVKPGTRAAQLPDSSIDVPSGLLANLGRPVRESACECERNVDLGLGSVMALLSGPAVSGAINDPKNELAQLAASVTDDRQLVDDLFLRTLNRHANEKETAAALAMWRGIEGEHTQLKAKLAERESWWAPLYLQQQAERSAAVDRAQQAVAARRVEIAPQVAAAAQQQTEKIAAAETALAGYVAELGGRQVDWERTLDRCRLGTPWTPLEITSAKANNNTMLTKLGDGSYLASGPSVVSQDYTLLAEAKVGKITGLMLEVLPHESLPNFGPGRSAGNFVLSEVVVKWGDKAGKRAQKDVEFSGARADFTQAKYEVKGAINGKSEGGQDGWAIGGKVGEPHTARFAFAAPLGDEAGTNFTISLQQRFRDGFTIGRFRLWITTADEPLEEGVPESVAAVARIPSAARTTAQQAVLVEYHHASDLGLLKRQQALAKAKQPLPLDPQLRTLQSALAAAEQPVPIDATLAQLRADVGVSSKQTADLRLTGMQDLAWAIINTPSFLFNR